MYWRRAGAGRGKCGEAARGLLGWQRREQELAGHRESPQERRKERHQALWGQREQPGGVSPEGAPREAVS